MIHSRLSHRIGLGVITSTSAVTRYGSMDRLLIEYVSHAQVNPYLATIEYVDKALMQASICKQAN